MATEEMPMAGASRPKAMAEGFTVAAMYAAVVTPLMLLVSIWQAGSLDQFYAQANVAGFLGRTLGLFTSFGLCLSGLVALRNRAHVTKEVLTDWRFWVILAVLSSSPTQPVLGWLWCCLIYSHRDRKRLRRHAAQPAVAT
jgi:hypothetical protein